MRRRRTYSSRGRVRSRGPKRRRRSVGFTSYQPMRQRLGRRF